jgi:hypothetical protein
MPTLTEEGRALAAECGRMNADLGVRLMSFMCRVHRLEKAWDEVVENAQADELARVEPQGNVLAWRGRGN